MKKFSGYYVQIVNLGTPDRKVLISTGVGALLSAGGPGLDRRRLAPAAWSFPPGPGRGSRLSLEKARTQRVAGGYPPPPVFLWPARCSLARFGVGSAAERWKGYYGAHARALIWIRILREQGVGEKAFCCKGILPTKASPWGEAVTEGDG